jgi:hypothetical protein
MANPEHLEILKQGVDRWNEWREKYRGAPKLRGSHLAMMDLSGANLRDTDLHGAELEKADLSADLSGADLGASDLRDALLRRANLRHTSLKDTHASGADFRRANLSGADLGGGQLDNANFGEADLRQAQLAKAYLRGASFRAANLRGTDFRGADLQNANLHWADLTGTNFGLAQTGSTIFANIDLSQAIGLETIQHRYPSTIGIDTIYKSGGKIPEVFLRGCGVPDEFIAYIGSMVGRPIEFYSCFISYSTKDQEFAERLHADLQDKGVRCWFAPHDIKGGRKIHEQIDEAIRLHDKLLLILSEDSMKSEWVNTEIAKARKREVKDDKRVLFPVRLVSFDVLRDWECFDADSGKDSAREIREYFIPDFSNWKEHDSYQAAFQRLVKDLKAEANKG